MAAVADVATIGKKQAEGAAEAQPSAPPSGKGVDAGVAAGAGRLARSSLCRAMEQAWLTFNKALIFTMGLGWLAFTEELADAGDCGEGSSCFLPSLREAAKARVIFLIALVILLPLSALLIYQKLRLTRRSEEAAAAGDFKRSRSLAARALALQTLVSWGVGFALAGQLAAAASATLPSPSWQSRAALALALVIAFVLLSYLVLLVGSLVAPQHPQVLDSIADTLISGSAYTVALAFLDVAVAAFSLDDINGTTDLGFLAAFTAVTLGVITVALAALACFDRASAVAAARGVERRSTTDDGSYTSTQAKAPAGSLKGRAIVVRSYFGSNIRKLLAKTLSMCGVVASYALIFSSLSSWDKLGNGSGDMSGSLTLAGSAVFFVAAFAVAVVASMLIECFAANLGQRLKQLDIIPNLDYDDYVVEAVVALSQTTAATILEALAWLVGAALHELALGGYHAALDQEEAAQGTKQLITFGYAGLLTAFAVVAMIWCSPPSAQTGSSGAPKSSTGAASKPRMRTASPDSE